MTRSMLRVMAPVLALAIATPGIAQTAKLGRSRNTAELAALPQRQGDVPVVAIYEVRSGIPEIQPRAATDMFTTALIESRSFQVAERQRLADGVQKERALAAGGTTAATVPAAPFAAARYIFEATISQFNPGQDKSDNSFTAGGAEFDRKGNIDVVAMDVRIIDVSTGLVVDSVHTVAKIKSRQKKLGGLNSFATKMMGKLGSRGSVPLDADANLSSSHADGLDQALRNCIDAAVAELARRLAPTPQS